MESRRNPHLWSAHDDFVDNRDLQRRHDPWLTGVCTVDIYCPPIMATIRNGRISTTFEYARIIGVPDFFSEPLEHVYSDKDLQSVASVLNSASARAARKRRKIS